MPIANLSNFNCHYLFEDFGRNKTIILGNSLGCDFRMWEDNIPYLSTHYNILRFDKRGHGKSSYSGEGKSLSIGDLAGDVVELIDYLNKKELDYFPMTNQNLLFCGLSISGLIGLWLGIHYTDRFSELVVCSTAAKIGTPESWRERIEKVLNNGMKSIAQDTLKRWISEDFITRYPEKAEQILVTLEETRTDAYAACCKAISSADLRNDIDRIKLPTLIISANQDTVTTNDDGSFLKKHISNSEHHMLNALHLCNVEFPQKFSELITNFSG